MKKIFTLLAICAATVFAASADATTAFVFVDENGDEVPSGYEVVINDAYEDVDPETGEKTIILFSGLYIKRSTAEAAQEMRLALDIETIDNGFFQLCFPVICNIWDMPATDVTESTTLDVTPADLQCEWYADGDGECTAKLTVELGKKNLGSWVTEEVGASVTLKFQYSEAGVNGISADAAVETARYNLAGQRLAAPQPGVNIVRYSDGSAKKQFVK